MSEITQEQVLKAFQQLEDLVEGEVRHDKLSRVLYSTDASIYQVEPYGVVLPKNEDDIRKVVQVANQFKIPIIPRAGGTSLAGQCVGKAIILDVSKYMNQMLVKNIDEEWVWAQPGLIQDELSRLVDKDGYHFGPDTSTSNRAMVGGMIGNNSCGSHSIYYGKTIDHTLEMEVVLSDGSVAYFRDLTPDDLEKKKRLPNLEGHIYREVSRIATEYKELIQEKIPKITRRNTGYLLDELIREDVPLNLSRIVCGSEGTLALVTKAKLRICPKPKVSGLMVAQFRDLMEALKATVEAIQHKPSAVELVDKVILDLVKDNPSVQDLTFFLEDAPDSFLAIEFYGDSKDELNARMDVLEKNLREQNLGYTYPRLWGKDIGKVWKLRKAGLGVLMGMPGDAKPVTFVEDTAVPPERLPEYIAGFQKIMKKYETECTYYAHASVGELHMRPILNLKDPKDLVKFEAIGWEVADLVIEHGGSISGEHGDGRVRSPFHKRFFGDQLYEALRELKKAFDPNALFNPGKIVDPLPMLEDLRFPPGEPVPEISTQMSFETQGGYFRALEFCNGAGACRKTYHAAGTMCPSYQATLEETHTTRGRANTLRTAIQELGTEKAFTDPEVYKAMDLCLECKACKTECPSTVDMAKIKYEYLQKRMDQKGIHLGDWAMAHITHINKMHSLVAPLMNWLITTSLVRWVMKIFLKVHPKRSIPKVIVPTTRFWFKRHKPHANAGKNGKTVCFFADPFINYNEPHIGVAAVRVLEGLGYDVRLSPVTADGRPLLSKGFLREAKSLARSNMELIRFLIEQDIPMIGVEPSTILTFRDEYVDFFPNDPIAEKLKDYCLMIDEFLVREGKIGRFVPPFEAKKQKYLFHGHCFQKSLVGTQDTLQMLKMVPGVEVEEIPSGCCGMAGSFGFHVDKYDVSMTLANQVLLPAIRKRGDAEILAMGTSCRHQIEDGVQYHSKHPIEILSEALPENAPFLPKQMNV